jgi:hypothetical protein
MTTNAPEEPIQFHTAPSQAVTTEMVQRHVRYHPITEEELDMVAAISNSIHVGFLGITAGAFIAFWLTVKTVTTLTADDKTLFIVLMWVTGLASAYFIFQSIGDFFRARRTLTNIKRRQTAGGT